MDDTSPAESTITATQLAARLRVSPKTVLRLATKIEFRISRSDREAGVSFGRRCKALEELHRIKRFSDESGLRHESVVADSTEKRCRSVKFGAKTCSDCCVMP